MDVIPRKSRIANDLADVLLNDINSRDLAEGDRYYTTKEICDKYGVCTDTASIAMRILADQGVLVRLRQRGTFIGSTAPDIKEKDKNILVLAKPAMDYGPLSYFFSIPYLLAPIMQNAEIQTHILEDGKDILHLQKLQRNNAIPDAIITGLRSHEVFEFLAELNIPIVVMGTLDPGMPDLPTIDIDFYQVGNILAKEILKRGHKHILFQQGGDIGADHRIGDGIADTLSSVKLAVSLKSRSFSGNVNTAIENIKSLLKQKNPPTAVITRGEFLAGLVETAAEKAGLSVGKDIEIFWTADSWQIETKTPYIHVQPAFAIDEVIKLIADQLNAQLDNKPLKERNIYIPAELKYA